MRAPETCRPRRIFRGFSLTTVLQSAKSDLPQTFRIGFVNPVPDVNDGNGCPSCDNCTISKMMRINKPFLLGVTRQSKRRFARANAAGGVCSGKGVYLAGSFGAAVAPMGTKGPAGGRRRPPEGHSKGKARPGEDDAQQVAATQSLGCFNEGKLGPTDNSYSMCREASSFGCDGGCPHTLPLRKRGAAAGRRPCRRGGSGP